MSLGESRSPNPVPGPLHPQGRRKREEVFRGPGALTLPLVLVREQAPEARTQALSPLGPSKAW